MHTDHPHSRRADFVIAGTQKGGTTALDAYLRLHGDVCMARPKELHFFDAEANFQQPEVDYSAYHEAFSPQGSHQLLGESTPIYMYWFASPRRMWSYNPELRIIVILRNPIERAFSAWNMERNRGREPLSFWDAISAEQSRCREALPNQHRIYSYVDRGFYVEQLRRVWHFFPRRQTLVLKTDDLRSRPIQVLGELCGFLGIDPLPRVESQDVHSLPYATLMERRERDYLRQVFEFEIRELERLLDWDCSQWLEG